jgi:tetratricopeptide (TPR) repeat protein
VDDSHPTREELEGLMLGGLSPQRDRAVILHLLNGCEACAQVLLPYVPPCFLPEGLEVPPPPFPPEDYDAPIDRAFAFFGLRSPASRTPEEIKSESLHLLAAGGLAALSDAPSDLSGIPLFEALLERSWALRHDDPIQMVQLAHAAALQATRLDESEIGTKAAADLRCRAFTELANAYRVADELDRADEALILAVESFHLGTLDPLLGAWYFTVFASQQAARRRFDLAGKTLAFVASAYRQQGDYHLAGRAVVMQGIFSGYLGKAEEAVHNLKRGLRDIDEKRDPGLMLATVQSLAWFLVDCGRFVEAHQLLIDLRLRGLNPGGRIGVLKLRWLEGHVHAGLKDFDAADQALREVKQGFEEAGLGYKAALAGLELGAVWFQQGNFDDAEKIVLQCADVFLRLSIRRELTASLLLLRKAAEARHLSFTTLQTVIDLLHKEERSPRATPPEEP